MRKHSNTPKEKLKLVEEEVSCEVLTVESKVEESTDEPTKKFEKMRSDDSKAEVVAKSELELGEFEDSWEEKKEQGSLVLVAGVIVTFLAVVTGLVLWSVFALSGGEEAMEKEKTRLFQVEKEQEDLAKYSTEAIVEIKKQVRQFFSATSQEELKTYVDMPARVSALIDSYYETKEWVPKTVQVESLQPLTLGFHAYWMVQVKGEATGMVLVADKGTEYKVDWESYVCYNPATLESLVEVGADVESPFRVYAKVDDFYSYELDEKRYQCLKLTTREEETYLWAYIERGSNEWMKLYRATSNDPSLFSEQGRPMMLKLKRPEFEARANCFIVEDFVSSDWVYSEKERSDN